MTLYLILIPMSACSSGFQDWPLGIQVYKKLLPCCLSLLLIDSTNGF